MGQTASRIQRGAVWRTGWTLTFWTYRVRAPLLHIYLLCCCFHPNLLFPFHLCCLLHWVFVLSSSPSCLFFYLCRRLHLHLLHLHFSFFIVILFHIYLFIILSLFSYPNLFLLFSYFSCFLSSPLFLSALSSSSPSFKLCLCPLLLIHHVTTSWWQHLYKLLQHQH